MMARRCYRKLNGFSRGTAKKHADIAPRFFVVKSVEIVTCRHAGFATCAGVKIDGKCILLAFFRL